MMKESSKVYFSYAVKKLMYGPFVSAGFFMGLLIASIFGHGYLYLFAWFTILLACYVYLLINLCKTGVLGDEGWRVLEGITSTKFTIFMVWLGFVAVVFSWLYSLKLLFSQYGLF